MQDRVFLRLFLLLVFAGLPICAQVKPDGPVTLAEIRRMLTAAEDSPDLLVSTNKELISAIEHRGVDFVLTPEEEWALQLRDASDELIETLRGAVDPAEREYRLLVKRQRGLYETFAANFNGYDLTSKTAALNAGREFVAEFSDDPNVAQIVAYMRRQIPSLERTVQMLSRREEMIEQNRVRSLYRNSIRENNDRGRRNPNAQPRSEAPAPVAPQPAQKPL